MDAKPFADPLELFQGVSLPSVQAAFDYLSQDWPGPPGPRHRDALETCLKVLAGERSTSEAREAVLAAATEAGVAAEGERPDGA